MSGNDHIPAHVAELVEETLRKEGLKLVQVVSEPYNPFKLYLYFLNEGKTEVRLLDMRKDQSQELLIYNISKLVEEPEFMLDKSASKLGNGQALTYEDLNQCKVENWELIDGVPFASEKKRDVVTMCLLKSMGLKRFTQLLNDEAKRTFLKLLKEDVSKH